MNLNLPMDHVKPHYLVLLMNFKCELNQKNYPRKRAIHTPFRSSSDCRSKRSDRGGKNREINCFLAVFCLNLGG